MESQIIYEQFWSIKTQQCSEALVCFQLRLVIHLEQFSMVQGVEFFCAYFKVVFGNFKNFMFQEKVTQTTKTHFCMENLIIVRFLLGSGLRASKSSEIGYLGFPTSFR